MELQLGFGEEMPYSVVSSSRPNFLIASLDISGSKVYFHVNEEWLVRRGLKDRSTGRLRVIRLDAEHSPFATDTCS